MWWLFSCCSVVFWFIRMGGLEGVGFIVLVWIGSDLMWRCR